MLLLQLSAAMLIWLISLAGGYSAFHLHRKHHLSSHHIIHLAEAFAGGIFLGAALFHMLPDAHNAIKNAYPNMEYPLANLICAAGFCVLLFLESITHYFNEQRKKHSLNLVPLLLTFLISIHALSEGIALGVNQQAANIIIIFAAIAAHKSSEAFAVGLQLQKSVLSLKSIIFLFVVFSLMSPLGVALGTLSQYGISGKNSDLLRGVFNAFAAGTFLYLATLHKLHHAHEYSRLGELFFTLAGLTLMAIVAVWV